MFGHKHYVPILKAKAGERWAIDHLALAARGELTPLFEIHAHQKKDDIPHAQEMCDGLVSVWGTATPVFLDTIWLHGPQGDSAIIQGTFDYARTLGLQAIPVIRTTFDAAALDSVRDA